jgi:hypothetical protein
LCRLCFSLSPSAATSPLLVLLHAFLIPSPKCS